MMRTETLAAHHHNTSFVCRAQLIRFFGGRSGGRKSAVTSSIATVSVKNFPRSLSVSQAESCVSDAPLLAHCNRVAVATQPALPV